MARYEKDERGIGRMLVASWMIADMRRRAEAVKAVAEATAPVDAGRTTRSGRRPPPHAGRYKGAFGVSSGVRPASEDPPAAGLRRARAVGRVVNTAPEARFVEYGTEDTPAHETLRRALRAAG